MAPHPPPLPLLVCVQLDAIALPLLLVMQTCTYLIPVYRGIRALPLWTHAQWYLGVLPLLALRLLAPAW